MVATGKEKYEAPEMMAVKVEAENVICQNSTLLFWTIVSSEANSPADTEWERNGYGNANEI